MVNFVKFLGYRLKNKAIAIICTVLFILPSSIYSAMNNYEWGTSKKEIETRHELVEVKFPDFYNQMILYFGTTEGSKIKMFAFKLDDHHKHCGYQMMQFMVFYDDKLFMQFASTHELKKKLPEKKITSCSVEMFGKNNVPPKWFILQSDIWGQRAIGGDHADSTTLYFKLASYGKTINPPQFYQYSFFLIDLKTANKLIADSEYFSKEELPPPAFYPFIQKH